MPAGLFIKTSRALREHVEPSLSPAFESQITPNNFLASMLETG